MLESNSALARVPKVSRRAAHGLRIGEAAGWKLVQVAGFASTAIELQTAMRPSLGTELPVNVGQAISSGARILLKTGPERFWIITLDGEDLAPELGSAVAPAIGSVTSLSHGRACIWIDGSRSREVLATGIAVDLHPTVFRLNSFALTGLHHTPITIHRSDDQRYSLYVLRTFAVWTWEWITDAALKFGYEV